MPEFTLQQQMLTLSMIAYQGYLRSGGGALGADVAEALSTFEPVRGRWELCWGPTTYRPSISLFDDSMMFVARDRESPSRYAVVVRGTNPVSPTDWLFGDIWCDRLVPWPYAEGAQISLSTAFGLSALRSLRTEILGPASFAIEAVILRAAAAVLLDPLEKPVAGTLREVRERVHALAAQALPASAVERADATLEALERRSSATRKELKAEAARALEAVSARVQFNLFHFLEHDVDRHRHATTGLDLASYLCSVTDDDAEIWVTGHSKGAALASTLALWLADTQGDGPPEDERWDPDRRAVVHCMTFAGPTAGNDAFRAHSDRVIGDRCHRVENQLDLVPRGWLFEGLRDISGLYGELSPVPRALVELSASMAQEIEAASYQHVGKNVVTFTGATPAKLSFLEQATYQHVDAYLEWAGLAPYLSRKKIFGF